MRGLFIRKWVPRTSIVVVTSTLVVLLALYVCLRHFCFEEDHEDLENLLLWVLDSRNHKDFTDSNNISGYVDFVVPNIVHFIRFDELEFKFYEMLTIKAVYRNHRPDSIYIHCNPCHFFGKYWDMIKDLEGLSVRYMPRPTHIFGKKLGQVWHASDVARLLIMMTYGGIFLDNDCYVVQSLNPFRKFEFAIGWSEGEFLGTQVLVAHRDARFLRLWYETYHDYRADLWYYNAGQLPTTSVLYQHPDVVHRVKKAFGVTDLTGMLYNQCTDAWRQYHVVHLMIRHRYYKVPDDVKRISEFNEDNVKSYDRTFGEMARDILFPDLRGQVCVNGSESH